MKLLPTYLIYLIVLPSIARSTTADALKKCGETIHANSGTIEYKLNQQHSAGELCAFVIRTLKYSTILYELETHGFSSFDPDAVTILSYNPGVITESASLGPPNNFSAVLLDGYGAIVIFKSNTSVGTGFKLSFSASPIGDSFPGSSLVVNNKTKDQVQLPFGANYTGEAHYSFVVVTSEEKKISEVGSRLRLQLSAGFHVGFCYDFFRTYTFLDDGINYEGVFCDEENYETTYETQGMFIVGYFKGSEPTSGATGFAELGKS